MKTIYLPLLTLLVPAAAWAGPIYRDAPPSQLCTPAKVVAKEAPECEKSDGGRGNAAFKDEADKCWAKVEEIQAQVTKDLEARIGASSAGGQAQQFGDSQATYQESIAAHEYMYRVTQTALNQLDAYFDEVTYPEDNERDEDLMKTACYRDNVVAMDAIAEKMENKLLELAGKADSARSLRDEVAGSKAKAAADSVHPGAMVPKGKPGAGGAQVIPNKDIRRSDISGTEDKDKKAK